MENNRKLYNEVNETLLKLQNSLFDKEGKNTSVAHAIDTLTFPARSDERDASGETGEHLQVKTVLQKTSGLLQMLNMRIQNVAGNDLREESKQVAELKNTLRVKVKELKVNVAQVEGYLRYLQDFEAKFDKSNLILAINPKATPLLQQKPLRKFSFFVFEAVVPALVSTAAILPRFTESAYTSIFG